MNNKIKDNLDFLYKTNSDKYETALNTIKSNGYRVFRNANGEHIVKRNENFIYEAFGGVFGKIFKEGEN